MGFFALCILGSLGLGALLVDELNSNANLPSKDDPLAPEDDNTQNGTNANDEILGTPQDDILAGQAGDDTLHGFLGGDTIYGNSGDDELDGGGGDDILRGGDGNDTLFGGTGSDMVGGGDGNDQIYAQYSSDDADLGNNSLFGGAGDDWLYGGSGDDVMHGGDGNDQIYSIAGNDVLYGDAGNDTFSVGGGYYYHGGGGLFYGGTGDDTMSDRAQYGAGISTNSISNEYYGEAGDDSLTGYGILDGGDGDDILRAVALVGHPVDAGSEVVGSTLTGGDGVDRFEVGYNFSADNYENWDGYFDPYESYVTATITDFDPATENLVVAEAVRDSNLILEQHGADTWVVLTNNQEGYESYAMTAAVLQNVIAADIPAGAITMEPYVSPYPDTVTW